MGDDRRSTERVLIRDPATWGIAFKAALATAGVVLASTVGIVVLVESTTEPVIRQSAVDQLDHVSEVIRNRLEDHLSILMADVRFLASAPAVQQAVAAYESRLVGQLDADQEASVLASLDSMLAAFIDHRPQYFQARLIGREDGGREIVRVDRNGGNPHVVAADSLQQKGDRDYFTETIDLPPGADYVSNVNLNRELGVIQDPEIPTIRAALPLYGSGETALGIVVINLDFGYLLDQIQTLVPEDIRFYLTNADGDFLRHPDPGVAFAFERGPAQPIQDLFPSSVSMLETESPEADLVQLEPESLYLRRLQFSRGDASETMLLGVSAPYEVIFAELAAVKRRTTQLLLLFCLGAVAASIALAHFLTRPIRRIGAAASRFGRGRDYAVMEGLPTDRTDEIGVLARTLSDMSERLRAQMDELETARNEAVRASRAKSTFLANMSHEIRTPLTGMLGFSELLERELDGRGREFAENISKSGRRLTDTLTSLLTLANIEGRRLELHHDRIDIGQELADVIALARWEAERKGLALKLTVHATARNAAIQADHGALSTVLQNVLGNAIKYTKRGSIEVILERTPSLDEDGDLVAIHVVDTGIGIDAASLDSVFEPFMQESTGDARDFEGTGLGLSIARQLAIAMDGTIAVESTKGKGSRFTISFPASADEINASVPAPDVAQSDGNAVRAPRLLIVEDNEITSELMQYVLSKKYVVNVAANADEAAAAARIDLDGSRPDFDAVLVDINLGPGPSGIEVLRQLRAARAYRDTPIAAVTGYAMPSDKERLLSEGFVDYLPKPFSPDQLDSFVRHLVDGL